MPDGTVEYEIVSVPPFLAPGTSGAGPLASGIRPAEAFSAALGVLVSELPAVFDAGAPQAAVAAIEAHRPQGQDFGSSACIAPFVREPDGVSGAEVR